MTIAIRSNSLVNIDAGLSAYLAEIKQYPILSLAEEYQLAKEVKENQNLQAAHKLVTSHLKLVVKIAFSMRGYGLSLMDLISEGNIGLMHAVKKFDPDLGHRLSTYAMWWIKASIQEFIIKSWSLVKIGTTVAQKKLFFNLKKAKQRILNFHGNGNDVLSDEEVGQIANQLGVTTSEVKEMDVRIGSNDYSLDNPIYNEDGNQSSLLEYIPETRANQETMLAKAQESGLRKKLFQKAMSELSEREQEIVKARHLNEEQATLEELSQKYQISRERIRQIEARAMEKLKAYVMTQRVVCDV